MEYFKGIWEDHLDREKFKADIAYHKSIVKKELGDMSECEDFDPATLIKSLEFLASHDSKYRVMLKRINQSIKPPVR